LRLLKNQKRLSAAQKAGAFFEFCFLTAENQSANGASSSRFDFCRR